MIFGQGPVPKEKDILKIYNPLIEYCKLSIRKEHGFKVNFFGNKQILDLNKLYDDDTTYNTIFIIPYVRQEDIFPKCMQRYLCNICKLKHSRSRINGNQQIRYQR